MMQPVDGCYRDMAPMSGPQHAPQYGGGGAQRRSGELRSPPVIQPHHNTFSMGRNQYVGGKDRSFLDFYHW